MLFTRTRKELNYSFITDNLLMGVSPTPSDFSFLKQLDVRLVINMRAERKAPRVPTDSSIKVLPVSSWDSRFFPIKPSKLKDAVKLSLEVINNGGKVYVYCRKGRHRSLIMCAAILIAQGYSAEDAIKLIKKQRITSDPNAPHVKNAVIRFADWWKE